MGNPWGAAITSVSAGLQAIVGNKAYQNSLDAQKRGAAQGAATRAAQYKKTQAYLNPYYQKGLGGLNNASAMLQPGYQFSAQDPSYAWRLAEGQKALERGASARGNLLGGAQQKALMGYGQGMASQEYANQFGRNMSLANLGYGAAGQLAGYSNAFGNTQAAGQEGIANAEAANIMSKYQNWQNLDSQAAGAWAGYFGSIGGKNASSQNTAGNYGSSLGNYSSYNNQDPNMISDKTQGGYYIGNNNGLGSFLQNYGQSKYGGATNNMNFGGK